MGHPPPIKVYTAVQFVLGRAAFFPSRAGIKCIDGDLAVMSSRVGQMSTKQKRKISHNCACDMWVFEGFGFKSVFLILYLV